MRFNKDNKNDDISPKVETYYSKSNYANSVNNIFHDHIDILDFTHDREHRRYTYPCPCGDLFFISEDDVLNGEDVARCESCSLIIRVLHEY